MPLLVQVGEADHAVVSSGPGCLGKVGYLQLNLAWETNLFPLALAGRRGWTLPSRCLRAGIQKKSYKDGKVITKKVSEPEIASTGKIKHKKVIGELDAKVSIQYSVSVMNCDVSVPLNNGSGSRFGSFSFLQVAFKM
jgi:hypothetical protein